MSRVDCITIYSLWGTASFSKVNNKDIDTLIVALPLFLLTNWVPVLSVIDLVINTDHDIFAYIRDFMVIMIYSSTVVQLHYHKRKLYIFIWLTFLFLKQECSWKPIQTPCWWPGTLCFQDINNYDIAYAGQVIMCFLWGMITIAFDVLVVRNDRKYRYVVMFVNINSAQQGWHHQIWYQWVSARKT